MKLAVKFMILFLLSAPGGLARGADSAPDAEELTRLLNEFLAGASRDDIKAHERFWADDLIYTRSAGVRTNKREILEGLHPQGETSPGNFAYLFDRVALSEGRPQRYGTQGECVAGEWTTKPIERPEEVDRLRAGVGLPPLEVYVAMGRQICQRTGET